MHDGAMVLM